MFSKCAGCDQHNAVIYDDEDMYCHDCYNEKCEIEEADEIANLEMENGEIIADRLDGEETDDD